MLGRSMNRALGISSISFTVEAFAVVVVVVVVIADDLDCIFEGIRVVS